MKTVPESEDQVFDELQQQPQDPTVAVTSPAASIKGGEPSMTRATRRPSTRTVRRTKPRRSRRLIRATGGGPYARRLSPVRERGMTDYRVGCMSPSSVGISSETVGWMGTAH